MEKKKKTDSDEEVLQLIQKREATNSALKKILEKLNEKENKTKKKQ